MDRIILASASPRRSQILKTAGYDFVVRPVDVDESVDGYNPEGLVMELAQSKALACVDTLSDEEKNYIVVGADTLVFVDDKQLGKPASSKQWREYIELMSGRSHNVITGVCIYHKGNVRKFSQITRVNVARLSDEDIDAFIARGEDMDKAGGYAIQGYFSQYVTSIEGEYNNVVGFPIARFTQEIKSLTGGR